MPTLGVCMIVKNEEAYIQESLDSIKPYVDEIIVVDTGSTDATPEIAKKAGAKVHTFEWCDDFAQARNASLSHATTDWILILDADEVIAQKDMQLIQKLIADYSDDAKGFTLLQRNYTDDSTYANWQASDAYKECKKYKGFFISPIVRLFKRHPDVQFEFKVHEDVGRSIIRAGGTVDTIDIPIHHYGFTKGEKVHKEKQDKYLKLGLAEIKENPQNAKPYFEVGKVYNRQGEYEKAIEMFEKVIELRPNFTRAYAVLGETYSNVGNLEKATEMYRSAIELNPKEYNSYNNLGVIYLKSKEYRKALHCFDQAVAINPESARALNNLALTLIKLNRYFDAEKVFKEAYKRTKLDEFKNELKLFRKKMDERIAELKSAIAADKDDLKSVSFLSEIYFRFKKYDEARDILATAVSQHMEESSPDVLNLMVNLSRCHEMLKEYHLALKVLEDASGKDPSAAEFFDAQKERLRSVMNSKKK